MSSEIIVRSATPADAPALLEIYRPFVESSVVSFETEIPPVEEFAARISKYTDGWGWLVAERDDRRVGYAYASAHRERRAYQWSVETSAYVHPDYCRQGIARRLYLELFDVLIAKGYCNAYAGITMPNDASVGFHRSLGFDFVGVFHAVGRKFNAWHDVSWWQRRLRDVPPTER
jgi:phosphinothricin acetyltransferase